MKNDFQRCTRCIMDNSADPFIEFDEKGVCNYCKTADEKRRRLDSISPDEKRKKLEEMINMLKKEGRGKPYDCIMGISGGLDSSYLAYLGYTWGLRILAVHIDDGYDTNISKSNIKKLCDKANIDMRVIAPDAKQFNALTLAYMKAGVPNLAVPQDNILFAFLYKTVKETGIKYFLSGVNVSLESIIQKGNTHRSVDLVNIKDIHKRFGTEGIDKLEFTSSYQKYWLSKIGKVVTLAPLDLVNYKRDQAFKELYDFCGFEYYGRKHLENILTAFIQLYWLPKKFGVDKRTSHLSSMIVSGQMTREEALIELSEPLYDETMMNEYIGIIKNHMEISDEEFESIMKGPTHQHDEYKTDRFSEIIRRFLK